MPLPRLPVIPSRLSQVRRLAKPAITQADLQARLQIQGVMMDQSMLSKIENGQRPVTDVEVVAFAKALKVSVGWLLGEADNQMPSS